MSIATLILSDSAKSGVSLDFIRPPASDFVPALSTLFINNPNINKSNPSHVFTSKTNNGAADDGAVPSSAPPLPPHRGSSTFTVSNVRSMSPTVSGGGARSGSASPSRRADGLPLSPSRPPSSSSRAGASASAEGGTIIDGETTTGFAAIEENPAVYFESPVQFGGNRYGEDVEGEEVSVGGDHHQQRHRPDFMDDALMIELNDAAQYYGTILDLTRTNSCPELDSVVKPACYRYFHALQKALHRIEDFATDLDCMEEIERNVAETMAETLYNIFLCHFLTGAKYIGDANGGSIAQFTEAAAVIDYLMVSNLASDTERLEFSEDNLRSLSALSMATAHEVSLQYYYCDTFHQVETNAALAHKASYYYTLAAAIVNSSYTVPFREMMLNYCHIKRLFLEGMLMFIMGLEIGTTKGDSRRRKALEAFEEAQQHVLRVLPGDRLAAEMELTWFIKRCNKFKKIMKKGFLIEGAFTNKRRRTEAYAECGLIPKENILPSHPAEIKRIMRLEERRRRVAEGEEIGDDNDEDDEQEVNLTKTTSSDENKKTKKVKALDSEHLKNGEESRGAKVEEEEGDDLSHVKLNVKTVVNDEDIRLLPPPIAPSATHYHLIEAMVVLSAPSLTARNIHQQQYKSNKKQDKKRNTNGAYGIIIGISDDMAPDDDGDEFALSVSRTSVSSSARTTPAGTPRRALNGNTNNNNNINAVATNSKGEIAPFSSNDSGDLALLQYDDGGSTSPLRQMLSEASGRPTSAALLTTDSYNKANTQQPACSHGAALFYVDLNMEDASVRSNARTAVALAIRAARLDQHDRIGFISFDKYGDPEFTAPSVLFSMPADERNIASLTQTILDRKVNARFEGSHGPRLVKGLLEGINRIKNETVDGNDASSGIVGNTNIFIISDGAANGFGSDVENWQLINSPDNRDLIAKSGVRIHCFGATDAADHELLNTLSTISRGNSGTDRGAKNYTIEKTTPALTKWLVAGLSSMKQRVASSVEVKLKCSQGILIANVVSEYYTAPPTTQYGKLQTETVIPTLPIAAEEEVHIIVTFAVPATHTRKDIIDLADGTVDYFDPIRSKWESQTLKIVNVCSTRVLSREIHFWATQLQVVGSRGACYLTSTTASRTLLRGGEIVMNYDLVTTSATDPKSFTNLSSIEGSRFELSSNTSILFNEVAVNKIGLTLSRGTVKVISANECWVTVDVEGCYRILISPSSYASITFDPKTGEFTANCVVGNAKITCTDEDAVASNKRRANGNKGSANSKRSSSRKSSNSSKSAAAALNEVVLLPAPRQTSAIVPDTPSAPWVVDEKTFFPWVDTSNCDVFTIHSKNKLKNRIRIETQRLRTKAADTLRKVGRFLERSMRDGGSLPFFNPSGSPFATIICRQILLHVYLSQCKAEITNSVAYSTSNKALDKVRRTIDECLALVHGKNRPTRSWRDVSYVNDCSRTMAVERVIGGLSVTYQTTDAARQLLMQQSEKTRFAHMLAEQQQRELDEGRNQERERREDLLRSAYVSLDFGAVNRAEVRHILTVLYDLPHCLDAARDLEDILLTVGTNKSFSEEQFYTVINHCTSHLSPQRFDKFSAVLSEHAEALAKKIELNRVNRSLFSVFLSLDKELYNQKKKSSQKSTNSSSASSSHMYGSYEGPETEGGGGQGYVTIPELVSLFQIVFGDNLAQFKRVEAFTQAVIDYRNVLIEKAKAQKRMLSEPSVSKQKKSTRKTLANDVNPDTNDDVNKNDDGSAASARDERSSVDGSGEHSSSSSSSFSSSANPPPMEPSTSDNNAKLDKSEDEEKASTEGPKGPNWTLASLESAAAGTTKVTLDVFITAMADTFFKGISESTVHAQLAQIKKQIDSKAKLPQTMEGILIQQKLDEELQHLVRWDLRHIFDGVDKKREIPRITAETFKFSENDGGKEEELFQLLCAPVCILADIKAPTKARRKDTEGKGLSITNNNNSTTTTSTNKPAMLSAYYVDYFEGVRNSLREDWEGFLKMLQSYPALSVTHKQALRVSEHLHDPRIAPEAALSKTSVVAQLLSWARLVLRIAYLTNKYDAAPPVTDKILSEAVAVQKKAEGLVYVPRIAEEKKVPQAPSATKRSAAFETAFKPVFGIKPGVQNELGFGNVTKYISEPAPPPGSFQRLGKPKLTRVTGAAPGQSGTSAILAKMAEDVQKKTYGILAAAEVERCYRDDVENDRPASAPVHIVPSGINPNESLSAESSVTARKILSPNPPPTQSPHHHVKDDGLLLGGGAGPASKSQLSFRHLGVGEQQRLHRKLSSTTTGADASYLSTQGSQINLGFNSGAAATHDQSRHSAALFGAKSTMIPSPPPTKKASPTATTTTLEADGGGNNNSNKSLPAAAAAPPPPPIIFDSDIAPMITLNVSVEDDE